MMTPYMWALLLLGAALALVVLELFVPSGGLISLLSITALITSITIVYYHRGFVEGTIYLGFMSVLVPVVLVSAVKWWPYTAVGRRMLNVDPDGYLERIESPYASLLGKRGTSVTTMLLSGSIRVEGRTYDAVSAGEVIEANQPIKVVGVEGNRITVRAAPQRDDDGAEPEDPLARPASEILGDPFQDPLA